jgi:hypothetical protein
MTFWVVVVGTSLVCFLTKVAGYVIPAKWLRHERVQRINALMPIVLLSALVAVQTLTEKTRLVLDHRLGGVAVAVIALLLRAPFPVVVLSAAATSALIVHWH